MTMANLAQKYSTNYGEDKKEERTIPEVELTNCVRSEVFTVVTMKNSVFWDVTPCGSCKNRRFGGT
jgi:hypothetical protein